MAYNYASAPTAAFLAEQAAKTNQPITHVFITVNSVRTDITARIQSVGTIDRGFKLNRDALSEIASPDVTIVTDNSDKYFSEKDAGSIFYGVTWLGSLLEIWQGYETPTGTNNGELILKFKGALIDATTNSAENTCDLYGMGYIKTAIDTRIGLPDSTGSPDPVIYETSSLKTIVEDLLETYADLAAADHDIEDITGDFSRVELENTTVGMAIKRLAQARSGLVYESDDGKIYLKALTNLDTSSTLILTDSTNIVNVADTQRNKNEQTLKVIARGPEFIRAGAAPKDRASACSTGNTFLWNTGPVPVTGKCVAFDAYLATAGDMKLKFFRRTNFTDQITWAVLDDDCSSLTGWSTGATAEISPAGQIHLKHTGATWAYAQKNLSMSNQDFTGEVKVLVDAFGATQPKSTHIRFCNNTSGVLISLFSDGVYLWNGVWTKTFPAAISTGTWYIIRVVHTHAANTCDAYISTDGLSWIKMWTGQSDTYNSGDQRIVFLQGQDSTVADNSESHFDYGKVVTGLYAPTLTYVGGTAAITLKAGLNKDVQVDPPIEVTAGDLVGSYNTSPSQWDFTSAAGTAGYYTKSATDVTSSQTADYYTYTATAITPSIRPMIQVEPPVYGSQGTDTAGQSTCEIENEFMETSTIAGTVATNFYDILSVTPQAMKVQTKFLPSISPNSLVTVVDANSGVQYEMFRVSKVAQDFDNYQTALELLKNTLSKTWTTEEDFEDVANTLTNVEVPASQDHVELSSGQTSGTAELVFDGGVGKTCKWISTVSNITNNLGRTGIFAGWLETAFASETAKTNIVVSGGAILLDTYSISFAGDDFSSDNITPNGDCRWGTKVGSPAVESGHLNIPSGNYHIDSIRHDYATVPPSTLYGYTQFDFTCVEMDDGGNFKSSDHNRPGRIFEWGSNCYVEVCKERTSAFLETYVLQWHLVVNGTGTWWVYDPDGYNDMATKTVKILADANSTKLYLNGSLKITVNQGAGFSYFTFGNLTTTSSGVHFHFDNITTNINSTFYYSSGTFETVTHDFGSTQNWGTMTWTETLNGGTATFKVESKAADAGWNLAGASTVSKGQDISSLASVTDGQRYARVLITLAPDAGQTATPSISDFTINSLTSTGNSSIAQTFATSNDMTTWSGYDTFANAANSRGIKCKSAFTSPDTTITSLLYDQTVEYVILN